MFYVFVFEGPDMLAEFGGVTVFSVERACVLLSAVACLVINGSGGGGIISLYRCG